MFNLASNDYKSLNTETTIFLDFSNKYSNRVKI